MDDTLVHDYDAIKRREYYLRTRKLKGRKKGSVQPAPHKKTRAQRQAERRRKQEAQIAALKGRLEKLRDVLAELTKKAQERSGVDTSKTTSKPSTSSQHKSSGKTEKLTAAQKAAKAKADKKRREADQTPEAQIKSLNEKIKTIQERIAKMRKDGSVGARRNTPK